MNWNSPYCIANSQNFSWKKNGSAVYPDPTGNLIRLSPDVGHLLRLFIEPTFPGVALERLEMQPLKKEVVTKKRFEKWMNSLINLNLLYSLPIVVGRDLPDYGTALTFKTVSWVQHQIVLKYIGNCSVSIGNFCSIADGVTLMLNSQHLTTNVSTSTIYEVFKKKAGTPTQEMGIFVDSDPKHGKIEVKNDVWIGAGACIMGGVTIGNGSIVAANSHVASDIPDFAIVGGNPARVLKFRFSKSIISDLTAIAWWDWSDDRIATEIEAFRLPVSEFVKKYKRT